MILANTVSAENWDRFRGPNGAGQSDDATIPTTWEAANYLWKQPLEGVGHSSPVIWDNRLFLTSANVATGAQVISAFDVQSGKPQWHKEFDAPKYHINDLNSYASSTPAVDAQYLYVMWLQDGEITLAALNHKGDEIWRRDVGPFQEQHGFGNSPIVVDELIFVAHDSGAESAITAVDRNTGTVRWKLAREPGTTAFDTPCVLDPNAQQKLLLATSTATGLTAVDALTGKVAWQGFKDDLDQRCVSSPIVAGDLLFVWSDRGIVSCYDVATGKQHWRERVGGDFHSSPLRIGSRIFGFSRGGSHGSEAVVLAADKSFQVLARNSLNEPCVATPAVANHRLYLRTASTLSCIGQPAAN